MQAKKKTNYIEKKVQLVNFKSEMVTMTNNGQQAIMSKDNNTPAVPAPTTTPPKSDRRVGVF